MDDRVVCDGILPLASSRAMEPVGAAHVAEEFVASIGRYESQGKSITVERFEPKGEGRRPAVVVVHGSGGMIVGGYSTREAARRLAQRIRGSRHPLL